MWENGLTEIQRMSLLYIVKEEKVINSILCHHISVTLYIKLCIVLLHVLSLKGVEDVSCQLTMAVVVQNKLRYFYLAITLYVFMPAYPAGEGPRQGGF